MKLTLLITKTLAKRSITRSKKRWLSKRKWSTSSTLSKNTRGILSSKESSRSIRWSSRSNIACTLSNNRSIMRSITSSWSNNRFISHLQLFIRLHQSMFHHQLITGDQLMLARVTARVQLGRGLVQLQLLMAKLTPLSQAFRQVESIRMSLRIKLPWKMMQMLSKLPLAFPDFLKPPKTLVWRVSGESVPPPMAPDGILTPGRLPERRKRNRGRRPQIGEKLMMKSSREGTKG